MGWWQERAYANCVRAAGARSKAQKRRMFCTCAPGRTAPRRECDVQAQSAAERSEADQEPKSQESTTLLDFRAGIPTAKGTWRTGESALVASGDANTTYLTMNTATPETRDRARATQDCAFDPERFSRGLRKLPALNPQTPRHRTHARIRNLPTLNVRTHGVGMLFGNLYPSTRSWKQASPCQETGRPPDDDREEILLWSLASTWREMGVDEKKGPQIKTPNRRIPL